VTNRTAFWLNLAVKAALIGLLLFSVFSGLERFEGKAMAGRALTYPLAALIVPAAWWLLRRRGKALEYPYALDALLVLPFLIDVAGNALDLYDTIEWWDDANHFVNWALLCAGLGLLITRRMGSRWAVVLLVTGLGAVLAIGWELGEWFTFIRHGTELGTAYEDTLGDEALGTLGALVAGLIVSARAGGRRERAFGG
jgi:uncharacterized membrane protein YjdF